MPPTTHATTTRTPSAAGTASRCRITSAEDFRHGSAGATAIRNSSARPSGITSRLKYGAPTDTWDPLLIASYRRGNTVPRSTTKANRTNTRLLARNAPSRLNGESMPPGDRSRSPRQAMSPTPTARTTPKNPSSRGPIADVENECTDWITPERVRNVPRMVRLNVAMTSERFHTRRRPRRCWTMTEWR